MTELRPGIRVVIRYTTGRQASDALGTVHEVDEARVVVRTKSGPMEIPRQDILLVHEVPPAPQRSGALHRIVAAADLRKISAQVWLPSDLTWLNADNLRAEAGVETPADTFVQTGWLLRAAAGVSQRANSVLPLAAPGIDLAEAMRAVEAWYAARDLPVRYQIFSEADATQLAPSCAAPAARFRDLGLAPSTATLALTAATREVADGLVHPAAAAPPGLRLVPLEFGDLAAGTRGAAATEVSGEPQLAGGPVGAQVMELLGYPAGAGGAEVYRSLLCSPADGVLLTALADHPDETRSFVGVVRVAISQKWAVVSNLAVAPALRRRGAGRALVRAAAAWAARRGVRSMLAEVEADNTASRELFTDLGAEVHHRYWYAAPAS